MICRLCCICLGGSRGTIFGRLLNRARGGRNLGGYQIWGVMGGDSLSDGCPSHPASHCIRPSLVQPLAARFLMPSEAQLKATELRRRELLRKSREGNVWSMLGTWHGTILPDILKSPALFFNILLYFGFRALMRFVWTDKNDWPSIQPSQIGIIGGFMSFFLVFFASQTYSRFNAQYNSCMACEVCGWGEGAAGCPGQLGSWPQGCIRREGTSEAAPEAVRQAVGGGRRSGWGRLLSVTNAIEAGTCRQGDTGWA